MSRERMGEDDERINACTSRERMGEEDALVELHAMVARVSFVSVTLLGVSKQRVARLRLSPVFSLVGMGFCLRVHLFRWLPVP